MRQILILTARTLRFSGRWAWRFSIAVLLLLAISLLSLRLLTPWIDWRTQAQQALTEALRVPVIVHGLQLAWWGWGPELRIQNLTIHSRDRQRRLFDFQSVHIRVDLSRSLWQAGLVLSELRLQGGEAIMEWPSWFSDGSHRAVLSSGGLAQWPVLLRYLQGLERAAIQFDHIRLRSDSNKTIELGHAFSLSLNKINTESHQLKAVLKLSQAWGESLALTANITADSGHFYVRGEHLKPAVWSNLKALQEGSGTFGLWGDWHDQKLDGLFVQADITGLRKTTTGKPNVHLSAQARRQNQIWSGRAHIQDTDTEAELYTEFERQPDKHWHGRFNAFDFATLRPWLAALGPGYAQWLERLQPDGSVSQLEWQWDAGRNQLSLAATIENFNSQTWGRIPGVRGLSAEVQIAGQNGRVELSGDQVQFNWPLLRGAVQGVRLQGPVRWQPLDDGWAVDTADFQASNSDFKARVNGGVNITSEGPWFDLTLAYDQIDIARILAYLPTAIMKPKLVSWLDHALTAGTVLQGTTVLRGKADDFPFDQAEGLFQTQLQVAGMRFDYFPGWTGIDDLNAGVTFRNRSLSVQADSGSLGAAELRKASAQIDDLSNAELHINAELFGATADMLQVLAQSPLREKVWRRLAGLQADANNRLTLDLLIPIKDKKARVAGTVAFAGGTVQIPEHNVRFDDVHGAVHFTESSVRAKNLQLRFLNAPAQLTITPQKRQLDFHLRGRFDTAALVQPYSDALGAYLRGSSDWDIALRMPAQARSAKQFDLSLHSTLNGTEVLLPFPLGKPAEQDRPLQLDLTQDHDDLVLRMQAEPGISAALKLVRIPDSGPDSWPDSWTIQGGELRLNSGEAELPKQAERLLFAQLPHYTLNAGAELSETGLAFFDRSELWIKHIDLSDWRTGDVRLQGSKSSDGYKLVLSGNDAVGELFLPQNISTAEPIYLTLDKLRLHSVNTPVHAQTVGNRPTDPSSIPPLHIGIKQLYLDDRSLGRLNIALEPTATGLSMRKFELSSDQHQISASAEWWLRGAQQWSRVQAKLYSQALGKTLALWNIPLQLERAKTALGLDLSWPGALSKPDVSQLNGELQIHVEEGLLSGVNPGLGRVVGLFNIASLARRLAFDFNDLLESGLAFDQIDGSIRFADGQANTNNLLLQGPAVNIAIQGSLGLRDQQMQHTVIVVPQIASSLALAGTVAGGPAVGAAVLLAGQVLKPGLEQAVSFRYNINGTLADPVIQQISAPAASETLRGGARR